MRQKLATLALLIAAPFALSGCVPLVVGAGGAIAADTIAEDRNGGDGLF